MAIARVVVESARPTAMISSGRRIRSLSEAHRPTHSPRDEVPKARERPGERSRRAVLYLAASAAAPRS
jgi:hypothetical protein